VDPSFAHDSRFLAHLECIRDRTLRRLPSLRVHGPARALRFINDVGLASLFATHNLHLPCLWQAVCGRREPRFPQHSHYDPEVGLAWNLKDRLPAEGKVFYAKLIRGRPTFVAWDLFPSIYKLFGPQQDFLSAYRAGLLSPAAKAIIQALQQKRPQDTLALKLATNLARPSQRPVFDAAMAEVQQKLYVAMREVRYDPFTYVWDLVAARFPTQVAAAKRCRPAMAARTVAQRYLRAVTYANPHQLLSVLGSRSLLSSTLADLARDRFIEVDLRIPGLPGNWIVLAEATRSARRVPANSKIDSETSTAGAWILRRVFFPPRFDAGEVQTLLALLDTLIPEGEFPGARRTSILASLLRACESERRTRRALREGVHLLDRQARALEARSFVELDEGRRADVVNECARAADGTLPRFFYRTVRHRAMQLHYGQRMAWSSMRLDHPPQPDGYPDYWRQPDA